ncbi:two-component system, NarL family, sensor histidine kinase DesK [Lentzea waywayandensis]|uniref:Two-component system, NarL family, sensor histidine kinase DesK n=1 Tax=Lentzea waywayandensis TaxID=84724 RepID=A0A1I6FDL1_9PSEU|nr:two-component system, NarL family, sensor histidine kinase DesK [Lentzea waywayandensis]
MVVRRGKDNTKWFWFALVFVLLYIPSVIYEVVVSDRGVVARVVLVLLLVAYAVGWMVVPRWFWSSGSENLNTLLAVGLAALGLVVVYWLGMSYAGLMVYIMSSVAVVLKPWRAILIDGTVLLALAGTMFLEQDLAIDGGQLATLLSISLGMLAVGRMIRANMALSAAQEEIAAMARTEERSRLARDLHDILGHSLTTIALKAGVARRLLESSSPDRALEEIREVEHLSRQALGDVRTTVSGYREVSLSAEVAGARAALRTAGVEADLPHAVDNVRPELQGVFGYVLREAITNVLRHAAATRCSVRLGDTWLEVWDNGRGTGVGTPGNGLKGLEERLAPHGGTVLAGPLDDGGYRLRAEVA